jgi:hypothetical protein
MPENYPEWLPLLAWSVGPLLAALFFTARHPDRAWQFGVLIEGGVIAGILLDIQIRTFLGMSSTVWPLAIPLVVVISLPSIVGGVLIGRAGLRLVHRNSLPR